MRLIDVDKIIEQVCKEVKTTTVGEALARITQIIGGMEMIQLVRCKDCKQWDAELGCCTSYTIVKCTDGREGVSSEADDFCSRGERKDD